MFDRIADRYDLLNRVISLGVDQRWRWRAMQLLDLGAEDRVLDVATGTADLALQIACQYPSVEVVGVDPSSNMLSIGQQKVHDSMVRDRVTLLPGDAQALDFATASFDATCIAFGIRNVPDRERGLAEMARVTRRGGRVVILELSEPGNGFWGPIARWHVHSVVPWVGSVLSGAREYRYLQESIAAFPPPDDFAELMNQSGLAVIDVLPLTFGVAHLFVGESRGDSK